MSDAKTLAEKKTYYIKASDRKPELELILYNEDGTVKDLTGVASASLVVAHCVNGRRIVDEEAMTMAADRTTGTVTYAWGEAELITGDFLMEVILDLDGSTQESFPKGTYYKLSVLDHL